MKLPKNMKNINTLLTAVSACKDDVIVRSVDGNEEYSLKTALYQLMGIARACEAHGGEYEVHCVNREDEGCLKQFFTA